MAYADVGVTGRDYFNSGFAIKVPQVVCLSNDLIVVSYIRDSNNYGYVVAGTISGAGSITWGTAISLSTQSNDTVPIAIDRLTDSTFAIAYQISSPGFDLRCHAGSVSGTTITMGTPITIDQLDTTSSRAIVCYEGSHITVCAYKASATSGTYAHHVTASGTTLTDRGATSITADALTNIDGCRLMYISGVLYAAFCGIYHDQPIVYHVSVTGTAAPSNIANSGALGDVAFI